MVRYEKVFIALYLYVNCAGEIKPCRIEWEDQRLYEIDKVIDVEVSPPPHVGSLSTYKYTVLVQGRKKELYLEQTTGQWFVEKPIFYDE